LTPASPPFFDKTESDPQAFLGEKTGRQEFFAFEKPSFPLN